MKTTHFFMLICAMTFVLALLAGCSERPEDADITQRKATAQAMREAQQEVGMPAITNFQERKLAKLIFELRDQEDLICYAYIINLNGDRVFLGKCVGFGLPYSVQFTNPMRLMLGSCSRCEAYPMPQADPNGLFMPDGLSATWLMLIDPETNEPRPVYVEPEIMVSPFPLHNVEEEGAGSN